jgi:hypothetical protein
MYPHRLSSQSEHQVIKVPSCDRWQIQRRLQELSISAWCSTDGYLRVEVRDHVESVQVWSVVQQFIASRTELVGWLEQCWS